MAPPVPTDAELRALAEALGAALAERRLSCACVESCTGGWVAQVITAVPGSSGWFERGVVAYSNAAKRELLGVSTSALARHGAVSEQVARAMAEGGLARSRADVVLAVTGVAGPGGGTPEKPVGTVWFAWAGRKRATASRAELFAGDREAVRRQSVRAALAGLHAYLAPP
jgi:nicotinamide-nucleotide amidase